MIQTLLAVGVPGSRVVLVQPPVSLPTCFNNPFIEDAVTAALKECGKCLLSRPLASYLFPLIGRMFALFDKVTQELISLERFSIDLSPKWPP